MVTKTYALSSVYGALTRVALVAIALILHETLLTLQSAHSDTDIANSVIQRKQRSLSSADVKYDTTDQPLVSIPPGTRLPHPFESIFSHPYALVLATRRCKVPSCSFVGNDLRINASFTQNGFDHVWLDQQTSKSFHANAPLVMHTNRIPTQHLDPHHMRLSAVVISVPPLATYTHSEPILHNTAGIDYFEDLNSTNSVPSKVQSLFKKRPYPDLILLPSFLPQNLIDKIPPSCRIVSTTRMSSLYPTAEEFNGIVKATTPPATKSTFSKRHSNSLALFGLASCTQIHTGAVKYLHALSKSEMSLDLYGPAPGNCLPDLKTANQGDITHLGRVAGTYLFSILFLDLMEGSGGAYSGVVPDLVFHALANWDTVLVVVSSTDVSQYFPCVVKDVSAGSANSGCVILIDPAKMNPRQLVEHLMNVGSKKEQWEAVIEWRRQSAKLKTKSEIQKMYGHGFVNLWNHGMRQAVCSVCEVAAAA